MTSPEDMESLKDIESKFETDHSFASETVAQTLGRFVWLSTRLQAELALTLFDLDIDETKIPAVIEAFGECWEDYYDFVRIGLDATRDDDREGHPQEESLNDAVDELLDTIDIVDGKDILDSHPVKGGNKQMMDYGEMRVDELLLKLNAHIHRLETEHER